MTSPSTPAGCGADLTESQLQQLLYATEGWISAVYLNLRTLADRGSLPERGSDIYNLFTAAHDRPAAAHAAGIFNRAESGR